jgi:hypothetical protein
MMQRQKEKRKQTRKRLVVFVIIATVYAGAVAARWSRATGSDVSLSESLGGWERAHTWWQRGQCTECHREGEDGEIGELRTAGKKPKSHEAVNWSQTHGRIKVDGEQQCLVCHSVDNCQSCHDRAPLTHTSEFVHPSNDSLVSNRHILLGRLRPSSCLVCHDSFVSGCSKCHAPGEVHDWQNKALDDLGDWKSLLRSARK